MRYGNLVRAIMRNPNVVKPMAPAGASPAQVRETASVNTPEKASVIRAFIDRSRSARQVTHARAVINRRSSHLLRLDSQREQSRAALVQLRAAGV